MRRRLYHAVLALLVLSACASEPNGQFFDDAGARISEDDARFVAQLAPAQVLTGAPLTIRVTMQNTGLRAWTDDVQLALSSSADPSWPNAGVEIGMPIPRGATHEFEVVLDLPSPGAYSIGWQLLRGEVEFGEATPPLTVRVLPSDCRDPASQAWLSAPLSGDTVGGVVPISLRDSDCIAWMELWIDGERVFTADDEPWIHEWDTALAHENPLPAPTHPIALGYYYADGRYGDHTAEVRGYTDLYVALPRGYDTAFDWRPLFEVSLANAAADGRRILLAMDDESIWSEVLDRAAVVWSNVEWLEVGHEPGWTRPETEAKIASLEAALAARGLEDRSIGVVYTAGQALADDLSATGLDWIGIEAYVDPPGDADPAVNVAALDDLLDRATARVPEDRSIIFVMMAYDRNGLWPDIETLAALQSPVYQHAHDDPRAVAIAMFSYARPGGSRDHPELRVPHMQIGERVLGVSIPALSDGEHLIEAIVGHLVGEVTVETATVTVANR